MDYRKHHKSILIGMLGLGALAILVAVVSYLSENSPDISPKSFGVLRVGVIDGTRLKVEAKCFEVQTEINQRAEKVLDEIRKMSDEMKKKVEAIRSNRRLTQRQMQEKIHQVEVDWKFKSGGYGEKMKTIKNLDRKVTEYVQDKLLQVISSIGRKAKIDVIINKNSVDKIYVFYNKPQLDMTDIIINELNKVIPSVNLKEFEK